MRTDELLLRQCLGRMFFDPDRNSGDDAQAGEFRRVTSSFETVVQLPEILTALRNSGDIKNNRLENFPQSNKNLLSNDTTTEAI